MSKTATTDEDLEPSDSELENSDSGEPEEDEWEDEIADDGDDESDDSEDSEEDSKDEALDELEAEELEMLTEDEAEETIVIDEAAELRAISVRLQGAPQTLVQLHGRFIAQHRSRQLDPREGPSHVYQPNRRPPVSRWYAVPLISRSEARAAVRQLHRLVLNKTTRRLRVCRPGICGNCLRTTYHLCR